MNDIFILYGELEGPICYPCCILSSLKTLVYEQMVLDPTMPAGLTLSIDDGGEVRGRKKTKKRLSCCVI